MNADAVVVGAGVNGLSTAFQLAKAGAGKVVVVERRHIGAGATGKSGALVRTHYTNEPETQLAVTSLRYFTHWGDLVGGDCGLRQVGLLVFVPRAYRHHLEANVAMHRRLGANAQVITAADARELDPHLWCGDVTHVAYEPDSGYADPNQTAHSFYRAGLALGVEYQFDTTATQILSEGERVTGVRTGTGVIHSPVVVVAAGAWANQLFHPLGLHLGLRPSLARVTLFSWTVQRTGRHMTYIDHIYRTWMRPDGTRTLIGGEYGVERDANPDAFPEGVPNEYVAYCRQQLEKRFPVMRHGPMRGNWAGVIMQSPDSRPIIGRMPEYEGLYCMTGDSGTSFKTSPAIGVCLAELITQGAARTVDLAPFRPSRFAEGKPWRDEYDYGLTGGTISR